MTTNFVHRALCLALLAWSATAPIATAAPAAATVDDADLQALRWRLVGPFQGGRVAAVAGIPGNADTWFFGGSDGGVWQTDDAGHRWRNISDCCITTGAIGAMAIAPSDRQVMYVGTGEAFPRGDVATGNGLWKSADGGKTWTHAGLRETRIISAIVIDPADPEHLWVAALGDVFAENAHRGVYESRDGGASWQRTLFVDQRSGAVDLVADAHDPRVLYAAIWTVQRRPWNLVSGGAGSGLYKSVDGGASWTKLSTKPGMPAGPLGKIGVAVSPVDPDRVYALVQAKDGGLLVSDDAGASWRMTNQAPLLRQRHWYFGRVYADPKTRGRIVMPQANALMVSDDAGKTFRQVRAEGGDNHVAWIAPDDPRRMIVGNDQGATITRDGGASWSQNQNQPTAAFYHVNVDDEIPFNLYGAQQERATLRVPSHVQSSWAIDREHWGTVAQWEAGFAVPVPGRAWITYSSGPFGLIQRNDRRTGERQVFGPWPDGSTGRPASALTERFQWVTPLMVSHAASDTIWIGSQHVWRTHDAGTTWERISGDLTRNDRSKQGRVGGPIAIDGTAVETYGVVFALAQSPLDAKQLWAGTDDGKVWTSDDDGAHWRDVTPRGLPAFATISSIDPSRLDTKVAYVAARRERQGDYAPYLFRTDDGGRSWRRIDAGLPREDASFVLRGDSRDARLLFAGTLRGVHVSFDGGAHWRPLQLNLPPVAVHDIALAPQQDALALGTHGRSFWVLDHVQPLREIGQREAGDAASLFTPQTAWLLGGYADPSSIEYGAGENGPSGAHVFYRLAREPGTGEALRIAITDADGATLARFGGDAPAAAADEQANIDADAEPVRSGDAAALPARPGLNRFIWNLRSQLPPAPGATACSGPVVVPGTYRVTLAIGDWQQTREFRVAAPPSAEASREDLAARHALQLRIAGKLCELSGARSRIDKLRERLTERRNATDTPRAQRREATAALATIADIHTRLFDFESDAYLDSVAHPTAIEGRIGSAAWGGSNALRRPTNTLDPLLTALFALADAQLARLEAIERQVASAD